MPANNFPHILTPDSIGIKAPIISNIPISSISWSNFQGSIPDSPQYAAHIYWNISYNYYIQSGEQRKLKVLPKPHIGPKSWANPDQNLDMQLLRHEYIHYLIGCLCSLSFQNEIMQQNKRLLGISCQQELKVQIRRIFHEKLNQHLQMQIMYDQQTNHYYNKKQQAEWQGKIVSKINSYYRLPLRSARKNSMVKKKTNYSLKKDNSLHEIQREDSKSSEKMHDGKIRVRKTHSRDKGSISLKMMEECENQAENIKPEEKKTKLRDNNECIQKNIKLIKNLPPRSRKKSQKIQLPIINPLVQLRS